MKKLTLLIPLFGLIQFGCEQDSSEDNNGIDNEKIEVEIAENVKVEVLRANGIQGLIVNKVEIKK